MPAIPHSACYPTTSEQFFTPTGRARILPAAEQIPRAPRSAATCSDATSRRRRRKRRRRRRKRSRLTAVYFGCRAPSVAVRIPPLLRSQVAGTAHLPPWPIDGQRHLWSTDGATPGVKLKSSAFSPAYDCLAPFLQCNSIFWNKRFTYLVSVSIITRKERISPIQRRAQRKATTTMPTEADSEMRA